MAVLKMTAIVAAIKGKISGTIFQTSPSGQVAKKFAGAGTAVAVFTMKRGFRVPQICCRQAIIPLTYTLCDAVSNPTVVGYVFPDGTRNPVLDYPSQSSVISQLSTRWRNLDPASVMSWSSGAVNFPFKNKFGEAYTGSGYAVYQSVNSSLINAMLPPVDICPIPAEVVTPVITVDWSDPLKAALMLVEFPDGIPAGTVIEFWSTPQRSAGRNSVLNQTLIASFTPQAAFNVPLIFAFQAKFGAPQPNGKLKTVFGGRSVTTNQYVTAFSGDFTFDNDNASAVVSISENTLLKVPTPFPTAIALGDVPALSEITLNKLLYGTKIYDPWSLETGGADAAQLTFEFNGIADTGGLLTGSCDSFGNLDGFQFDITIDTGAVGAHSASIILRCPDLSLVLTMPITWTSV